jgi:transcription elongation factor GreA
MSRLVLTNSGKGCIILLPKNNLPQAPLGAFFLMKEVKLDMAEKPTYLTSEGLEKLREELEYLRTVRRSEVAAQIKSAKEDGDLSENAGYEEAKNMQAFVEGRILTLEALLRDAVIINSPKTFDTVRLGSQVKVQEDGEAPEEFMLVGAAEADPMAGRISNESPLGHVLIGHRVGDQVRVQTPGGTSTFRILSIR